MSKISNIGLYAEAFKQAIQASFKGNVTQEPVDTYFRFLNSGGKEVTFPCISFYTDGLYRVNTLDQNFAALRRGEYTGDVVYEEDGVTESETKASLLQYIKIDIGFEINVWSNDKLAADEVAQELLFWLMQKRTIKVNYRERDFDITFLVSDELTDNTDLATYENQGKIYRYTLPIIVSGVLWRTSITL